MQLPRQHLGIVQPQRQHTTDSSSTYTLTRVTSAGASKYRCTTAFHNSAVCAVLFFWTYVRQSHATWETEAHLLHICTRMYCVSMV